jgi:hypothetical protein
MERVIDFAINHELVLYCMGKLYDMHFEKAVRTGSGQRKIDIGSIATI